MKTKTPPHADFTAEILRRGYTADFVEEYGSELYRPQIISKYRAADPSVWDDVQNLFDEYNYFGAGFDAVGYEEDDDEIIMMTN